MTKRCPECNRARGIVSARARLCTRDLAQSLGFSDHSGPWSPHYEVVAADVAKARLMSSGGRLSICYAAPGLNLLPTAGPTPNVLSVAEALSQWADVTVAFRHIFEPIEATPTA